MRIPKTDIVDLDEYKILIEYDGDGGLDITVLDELGEEIEGLYISNLDDYDDFSNDIDINLN
jgi:hypothetical protein